MDFESYVKEELKEIKNDIRSLVRLDSSVKINQNSIKWLWTVMLMTIGAGGLLKIFFN